MATTVVRSRAWPRWSGSHSTIYVPSAMRPVRREAIVAEGAELVEVDGDYDEAVRRAIADARADPACRAVNDADPEGTSDVARWVIDGYSTLFAEIDGQLPGDAAIDVVLLQTGVGAFAAAGARWAARRDVTAIGVDPAGAPCIAASLAAGRPVTVETTGHVDGRTRRGNTVGGRLADARRRARGRDRRRRRGGRSRDARSRGDRSRGRRVGSRRPRGATRADGGRCVRGSPRHAAAAATTRSALVVVTEGATDPERYARCIGA